MGPDPDPDLAWPPAGVPVRGGAVLLHPHPHFGGDRFHPLVDTLFRLLPAVGFGAVRFDLGSADAATARATAEHGLAAAQQAFGPAVVAVGYSFGAGVAAQLREARAWALVAPQAGALAEAPIGASAGPTLVVLAERDQFSPIDDVTAVVDEWTATTVDVVPGDHFLATTLGTIVERIVGWLPSAVRSPA